MLARRSKTLIFPANCATICRIIIFCTCEERWAFCCVSMEKKHCANCFCEIKSEPCPNCGYSKKTSATDADTLPCRTKLAKKYLVGGVIGRGGFGITYLALDIKSDKILAIKEYFPPNISVRERKTLVSRAPRSF